MIKSISKNLMSSAEDKAIKAKEFRDAIT